MVTSLAATGRRVAPAGEGSNEVEVGQPERPQLDIEDFESEASNRKIDGIETKPPIRSAPEVSKPWPSAHLPRLNLQLEQVFVHVSISPL